MTKPRTARIGGTTAVRTARKPELGPGERHFVLDVPYKERSIAQQLGAKWDSDLGHVFIGRSLPEGLGKYRPRPYTWQAWIDESRSGVRLGYLEPEDPSFVLRRDQKEDAATVLAAFRSGVPEFLNGSLTGVGKTATTIEVAKSLPGVEKILVVAPLTVLASWRNHLRSMGDGGRRWCLINPESIKKLIAKPPIKINPKTGKAVKSKASTANKRHAATGRPKIAWDLVISDESHLRANPTSQQSLAMDRIIEGPGSRRALVIDLSATAGTNPAELSYLHRGLAFVSGEEPQQGIKMERYAAWCQDRGVAVSTVERFGEEKLVWEANQRDLEIFNRLIYRSYPQWALRRKPEGWPEQKRVLVPVEFSPAEMEVYETAWEEFTAAMRDLAKASSGSAAERRAAQQHGLAAQIRYRQKAGMLRAPYSVDYARNLHQNGYQVAISCEFFGAVESIYEGLSTAGVKPALFTGRNKDTREEERVAFQRGKTPYIIFTPDSSIDLHQGDKLARGNDVPRALVVAQPRWSPKKSLQIEGRTQRSGEASTAHYLFAQDTKEVDVLRAMISGVQSMSVINGDDGAQIAALEASLANVAKALGAPSVFDTVE